MKLSLQDYRKLWDLIEQISNQNYLMGFYKASRQEVEYGAAYLRHHRAELDMHKFLEELKGEQHDM